LGSILGLKPSEAFPRARSAAEKALALDDPLSEAHASLALCAFYYDWDWAAAEREFRRALELRQENTSARAYYSLLLAFLSRFEEAMAEARRAWESDPLSPSIGIMFAIVLWLAGKYD